MRMRAMNRFLSILLVGFCGTVSLQAQVFYSYKIENLAKKEDFEEAIAFGQYRLDRLEENGEETYHKKAIPMLLSLGKIYQKQGDYVTAGTYFDQIADILEWKDQNKRKYQAIDYDAIDELSLFNTESGNYLIAQHYVDVSKTKRAERFNERDPHRYRYSLPEGLLFYKQGLYDSAFVHLRDYVLLIKNSNHIATVEMNRFADAYRLLALIELEKNHLLQAAFYANKNTRYQFHRWTKKEAGRNYRRKLEALNIQAEIARKRTIPESKGLKRFFGNVKGVFKGKVDALSYNNQAISRYNKHIGDTTILLAPLLTTRAKIVWDQGQLDQAYELLWEAAKIHQEFIKENFASLTEMEKENIYVDSKTTFDLLNTMGYTIFEQDSSRTDILQNLYDLQLNTKAIILNESNKVQTLIYHSRDTVLINKYEQWKRKKNELSKLISLNDADKIVDKKAALELKISRLESDLMSFVYPEASKNKEVLWTDVKKQLQEKDAAVEIIRINRYETVAHEEVYKGDEVRHEFTDISERAVYMALTLTSEGDEPKAVIFPDAAKLETHDLMGYRNHVKYRIEDQVSYDAFFAPIITSVADKTNIVISPDGVFNLINISSLKNSGTGRYVFEEVNIRNVMNTKVLTVEKKPLNFTDALLIGRPNFGNDSTSSSERSVRGLRFNSITDLPGTEEEVNDIVKLLADSEVYTEIQLHQEANEHNLKNSASHSILHIATHGFFKTDGQNKSAMMRSGLLLSEVMHTEITDGEDGVLTAFEITTLDLRDTELAVLSACESGLGEVRNGEGVYGLQRAFEVAGVNYLLISLWKVDDQATKDMMTYFYGFLVESHDPHEAFAKAQLLTKEKYVDSFYWGAFKLLGI